MLPKRKTEKMDAVKPTDEDEQTKKSRTTKIYEVLLRYTAKRYNILHI